MIVADASALASLGRADVLALSLEAFEGHTTRGALDGLEGMAADHGPTGDGARAALGRRGDLVVHAGPAVGLETSRVDAAQAACAALAVDLDAGGLLTDDLTAIPELSRLVPCPVVPSPVLLAALVRRGALAPVDARFRLAALVLRPGWLADSISRRVRQSLGGTTG